MMSETSLTLHTIKMENFKSYAGIHNLGPFPDSGFIAVIGPNGSGKSNLMDAIAFALCEGSRKLRGDSLKKLIFHTSNSASVELSFSLPSGEQVNFRRAVNLTGECKYFVNDERFSFEAYKQVLEKYNMGAGNLFLVFQGDADALAAQTPEGLTDVFERISGASELKDEYQAAHAAKQVVEEKLAVVLSKRNHQLQEKKSVAAEVEEFAKFRDLQEKRDKAKADIYLFKLWCVEDKLCQLSEKSTQAASDTVIATSQVTESTALVEDSKKKRAAAELAKLKADKAAEKLRVKVDAAQREATEAAARKRHAEIKIQKLREKIESAMKSQNDQSAKEVEISSKIDALNRHITAQEHELNLSSFERLLNPSQRQELLTFRVKLETETCDLQTAARVTGRDLKDARAFIETRQRNLVDLEDQRRTLHAGIDRARMSSESARASLEEAKIKVARYTRDISKHQSTLADARRQEEALKAEKLEIVDAANAARESEKEIMKESELKSTILELANSIGTSQVIGRVRDLIRPTQSRYNQAIQTALGKYLDAVIVSDVAAGQKVIAWLKERRRAPLSIIPLSEISSKASEQAPIEGCRRALDCVKIEKERVTAAAEFCLSGILIADDLTVARRAAFGAGSGRKVVTLAGEKIAKNGNISAEAFGGRRRKNWDVSTLADAKLRLEGIESELLKLHGILNSSESIEEIARSLRRAEANEKEQSVILKGWEETISSKTAQDKLVEAEVVAERGKINDLEIEALRIEEKMAEIQEQKKLRVQSKCLALAVSFGISEFSDWRIIAEGDQVTDEKNRKIAKVRETINQLESELVTLNNSRDRSIVTLETELTNLNEGFESIARFAALTLEESQALKKDFEKLASDAKAAAVARKDAEDDIDKHAAIIAERKREVAAAAATRAQAIAESDNLAHQKQELLKKAFLEDIAIADEEMSESIDFTNLPATLKKKNIKAQCYVETEAKLREALDALTIQIEKISPNLKANAKADALATASEALAQELETLRKENFALVSKFDQVKKERRARFQRCLEIVSRRVDENYKTITGAMASSAFLDPDIPEEPHKGGLRFTVIPPGKRLTEIASLSGGEKTMAAVALLFALFTFRKPPFVLIDEMDAALDSKNVRALARFISQVSDPQVIVISLKESLYVRARGLVGVYKTRSTESSGMVCLDLAPFAMDADEDFQDDLLQIAGG